MRSLVVAIALAVVVTPAAAREEGKARVDVVFCIDRSGSMSGVIETAKQKVWSIVNEIAKSKPTPVLRIGLIGYGSADQDIKLFPLSEDLDKVYGDLMTFKTDMGGNEWVGWAAKMATEKMEWSAGKGALKVIFMVGNETALQGRPDVLYTKTVPETIKRDITVNAIYAGQPSAEEERTWKEVAALADGIYTPIDLSGGAITIETPMDKKMAELSVKLNGTYLSYGREGERGRVSQQAQDANSAATGGAPNAAARAEAKAQGLYNCARWDLVDACKDEKFDPSAVKVEDLPKEMQAMKPEERKAHIEKMAGERETIQKEINQLALDRQKHIDAEMKNRNLSQDKAFDEAVRRAIREQGEKKGFTFENK